MKRWSLLVWLITLAFSPARSQTTLPLLPSGIAYDAKGNLFLADTNTNRILESSVAGQLTVIAGTGEQGYSGDNAAATSALLNAPQGIAVATDGTIYVADTGNQVIRAISPAGVISTIAGNGTRGFSGDNGAATAAQLNQPVALALSASGTLLIADSNNHRIRAITAGTITTFAGSGIQGFSGDGGQATAAQFDTPQGIAVASDGRIWISDSHNQRLRVIATDSTISTAAGTGIAGFAGDGGAATSAQLSLPRGITALADGSIVFADANNQRLRTISPAGIISTLAGSGTQGASSEAAPEASATLNNLRGVAASPLGAAVFADSSNRLVRALLGDQAIYSAAGFVPARVSTVTLSTSASTVYGSTSATVTVKGSAATPQGTVTVLDSGIAIASGALANGTASLALPTLATGSHTLSAAYAGDGFNPAATSATSSAIVSKATVVATATAASVAYGAAIPPLTGSLAGVLPQDASLVTASFTSAATILSPPASYPITATLTGPASSNYTVAMSPTSGALTVMQAASSVVLQTPPSAYAGLSWTLSAIVTSTTSGSPSGTVTFLDSGHPVATAKIAGGVASGVYLAPSSGSHTLTAFYTGDTNFLPSTSTQQVAVVTAMPDFNISSTLSSQVVQVGTVASFPIAVNSAGAAFSNPVTLSMSGLPSGVIVSLSPPTVIPGASGANSTLSFPTTTLLSSVRRELFPASWLCLLPFALIGFARRKRVPILACCVTLCLLLAAGCGTRTVPDIAAQSKTWTLTITGTATNLAGAIVSHSTQVTLTVE